MRLSPVAACAVAALALGVGCSGAEAPAPPAAAPAEPSRVENAALVFSRPAGRAAWQRYELLATDDRGAPARRFAGRLFPDRSPDVSPDGRTVAFTRPARMGPGGRRLSTPHDIFLAPVAGGPATRPERTPRDERSARFSDDGLLLSFAYPTSRESYRVGIAEIAERGSWDVLSAYGDQFGYDWEPGTHRILYSHGSFLGGGYDLYVTDADTAETTRIPNTGDLRDGGAWTPAGQIAAVTRDESKRPDEYSVWVFGTDGAERRLVATTRGRAYELAFAPDDGTIAASVGFKDVGPRVVVAKLGDEPFELTADQGVPGWSPMWSPDGSTIAFLRGRSVWLMDADGGNPRRVSGSRGAEHLVAWLG